MTDADDDGAHIQTLLIDVLLQAHAWPLIEAGRVVVYFATSLTRVKYASKKLADQFISWTNDELEAITSRSDARYELTRFKGLGKWMRHPLGNDQNPETRILIRKIEDVVLLKAGHNIDGRCWNPGVIGLKPMFTSR